MSEEPTWKKAARSLEASLITGANNFFETAGNLIYNSSPDDSYAQDYGESLVERARERTRLAEPYIIRSSAGASLADRIIQKVPAAVAGAAVAGPAGIYAGLSGAGAAMALDQATDPVNAALVLRRVEGNVREKVVGDFERARARAESRLEKFNGEYVLSNALDSSVSLLTGGKLARFQPAAFAADALLGAGSIVESQLQRRIAGRQADRRDAGELILQTGLALSGIAVMKANISGGDVVDAAVSFGGESAANAASEAVGERYDARGVITHVGNLQSLEKQNAMRQELRDKGYYLSDSSLSDKVTAILASR